MANAYGLVEITGVVAATYALDVMCKTADVNFVAWQKKLGGRLVTIIVEGNVAAVKEAVAAAKENCIKMPVATAVLSNPHPEVVRLITKGRLNNHAESEEEGGQIDDTGSIGNDRDEGLDRSH